MVIMRNLLISLSILFFALSGYITFKALGISVKSKSYNIDSIFVESKHLPHSVKNNSEKATKEQAANRALIGELQATIAKLENELSNMNEHVQVKDNQHETMKKLSVRDIVKQGKGSERNGVLQQKDENIVILKKTSRKIPVNNQKASQIYTIQTGSFITIERAQMQFDLIAAVLSEEELDYLRIERIGEYYCVRLGKFISNAEAKIKLESVKSHMPGCTIVKTRYLEERIERIYQPQKFSSKH